MIHIVAHVCGDPLSRYTCRAVRAAADFLRIMGFFRCSIAITAAIYRSPEACWARNPQKVSKRCSWVSGPECQKSVEKVPNDPKTSQKDCQISSGVRGVRWERMYGTNLDQVGPNMAKGVLDQLGQVGRHF